jgi:hypothetical protein
MILLCEEEINALGAGAYSPGGMSGMCSFQSRENLKRWNFKRHYQQIVAKIPVLQLHDHKNVSA